VVREVPEGQEQSLLEMALIENLQREDLNPIEEAQAYRRLCDQFGLTQDTVASRVGKDRATVANVLRLLKLPDEVRQEVAAGTLSMGHARALLGLANEADQRNMARDVVARSLSVRETETLVKRASDASRTADPAQRRTVDLHTRAAEERLRMRLGTRVRIVRQGTRGRIEIDFASETELIRLFEAIVGEARESRGMDGHVVG
jgi:ParB family chromosome partitioning protein